MTVTRLQEGPPEEADYFACEGYSKIICASWPLTQHQESAKEILPWDAHNHIDHLRTGARLGYSLGNLDKWRDLEEY